MIHDEQLERLCFVQELLEKRQLSIVEEEALAENLAGIRGIIVPCMDARRNQVYNALFSVDLTTGELTAMFKTESIPYVAFVKDNTFLDFSVGYVAKAKLVSLIEENK